ncbi:Ig-like domain-containing protein, partial [Enterobacter kobei]|uniref:Ig-like domain-containing protein n=1 Tax=Enterobacter kobei TaxID=208224 RepID=UPI003F57076D
TAAATANATFIADGDTAHVAENGLVITTDNAKADGKDQNVAEATVTDAAGNPVSGATVSFTTTGADMQIVTAQAVTNASGVATTALTSLKAGTYALSAAVGSTAAATANATFIADAATAKVTLESNVNEQVADGVSEIHVTAYVKDAQGNPVVGEQVNFTTTGSAVFSNNDAEGITNGAGRFTVILSNTVAEEVTVTATPASNTAGAASKDLTFTEAAPAPMPGTTKLEVNGETWGMDEGFPKTGFTGAKFQVAMKGNTANNSEYTWESDTSWVSVDSAGMVTFTSAGTGNKVTITATPKAGGTPLTYSFTLNRWFINNGSNTSNAADADAWCAAQPGGYATPSYTALTNVNTTTNIATRDGSSGKLYSEWGTLTRYDNGWLSFTYWVAESTGSDRKVVRMQDGSLHPGFIARVVCSRDL